MEPNLGVERVGSSNDVCVLTFEKLFAPVDTVLVQDPSDNFAALALEAR
jgi:hypothetical protein